MQLILTTNNQEHDMPIDPANPKQSDRCKDHPAYFADYCPVCGTARQIGAF